MKRFTDKIKKTKTCWLWTGCLADGYGKFSLTGKMVRAHRFAYELWVGPIPEGQIVRHTCHVRACVNPDHLVLGTHQDNMDDRGVADRQARGEVQGSSILTKEQVVEIYTSHGTTVEIANNFNVAQNTVWCIRNNKTWLHVTKKLTLGLPVSLDKARWIFEIQKSKGTQKQIAKRFNTSQGFVSQIKSGHRFGGIKERLVCLLSDGST